MGRDEDPVPRWSTRRDPEPLAGVTARPQRRLVSVGRAWRSGRDSEESARRAPAPKSRCRKPQGCRPGRGRAAHLRRRHAVPARCPERAELATGVPRHGSFLRWDPGQSWVYTETQQQARSKRLITVRCWKEGMNEPSASRTPGRADWEPRRRGAGPRPGNDSGPPRLRGRQVWAGARSP